MRLLHRLRPEEDRVEVDVLAVVFGLLGGPDLLQRGQLLVDPRASGGGVGAVVAHLLAVPADADAEGEPPVGHHVEAGDLLRGVDDVALRQERDPGAEHQPRRHRGDRGQRDERVQRPVVAPRQLAAFGPRRLPADRDVGVLGDEERVEPALLQGAPEHVGPDAVVGDERGDSEPHRSVIPNGALDGSVRGCDRGADGLTRSHGRGRHHLRNHLSGGGGGHQWTGDARPGHPVLAGAGAPGRLCRLPRAGGRRDRGGEPRREAARTAARVRARRRVPRRRGPAAPR